jgi:hypothetical protein
MQDSVAEGSSHNWIVDLLGYMAEKVWRAKF